MLRQIPDPQQTIEYVAINRDVTLPNRPRSHQIPPDSPDYVEAWARDLVDAVGKREARLALAGYKTIAANKQLNKADREIAVERMKALERLL